MGNYFQIALGKVIGTKNERELKRMVARVEAINALEPEMKKLADSDFPSRTQKFKERLAAEFRAEFFNLSNHLIIFANPHFDSSREAK